MLFSRLLNIADHKSIGQHLFLGWQKQLSKKLYEVKNKKKIGSLNECGKQRLKNREKIRNGSWYTVNSAYQIQLNILYYKGYWWGKVVKKVRDNDGEGHLFVRNPITCNNYFDRHCGSRISKILCRFVLLQFC